jgi:hypothetical protein
MKATVQAQALTKAGRRVLQMRRVTDTVPWSRMALFEARDNGTVRISIVNADGGAREIMKADGVSIPGSVALDVDVFDKLLTVIPLSGVVSIELDGQMLKMSCGRVRQRVPTASDPENFSWPPGKPEDWFQVPDGALSKVAQSVIWATSEDIGRIQSSAVHMTHDVSEATNGHVMGQVKPGLVPAGKKILVPSEAWTRIKAFESQKMHMAIDGSRLWLRGDNWTLFQRLLPEMDYYDLSTMAYAPDADGVHYTRYQGREHPVRVYSVSVNREEVLTTCRHILSGVVTRDERAAGSSVRILIDDDGTMHMVSHYPADTVARGIDVDEVVRWSPDLVTGDDLSPFSHLSGFCYYSLYMVKALSAVSGDIVKMLWADGGGIVVPLQFHDRDGAVACVSPRRL